MLLSEKILLILHTLILATLM